MFHRLEIITPVQKKNFCRGWGLQVFLFVTFAHLLVFKWVGIIYKYVVSQRSKKALAKGFRRSQKKARIPSSSSNVYKVGLAIYLNCISMLISLVILQCVFRWPLALVCLASLLSALLSCHTLYSTHRWANNQYTQSQCVLTTLLSQYDITQ